jgi:hypothetical protein
LKNNLSFRNIYFQPAESVPMLGEIEYLRRNKDRPLQSDLVFGITMLAESSEAFLWKGEDVDPVNCRIRALAMTGAIYKSVEEMRKTEEDNLLASASNGTSFVTLLVNFLNFSLCLNLPRVSVSTISHLG